MRLSVELVTNEEFKEATDLYPDEATLEEYYLWVLESSTGTLSLQSIPSGLPAAEQFRLCGKIEAVLMYYFRENESPEKVRIVCTDEEVARSYRMVYNYYYADTKADRMEDENWD